ncbi:mechanosensitive ion channel family protein [Motiliproteus sp. MSK22-1]|uniref:mechanosensitive ion channel family protein n=1 Tax=Motiliproteus sp. MSK22-1 TaxID=1897630 RepID=UPI000975A6D7|nr:mechanosensitive ion channel [Motiliproteus sp. MSK22-1]OMH27115.1 mechanosensitive ion channel protein MscS [Motiliproteus sp. MSK22-1]
MEFLEPLYDKAESLWIGFVKILPLLGIALITLFITWIFAKVLSGLLKRSLSRSNIRRSLVELFGTLLKTVIWLVGGLLAITIIFPSLTPAKLLTALGLGSVAVGLAFKDIFENFFAGILILLRKPMRIGDFIECEGVNGKVEHISIRETYLRKTDDQLVLIPNSFLFKNPVSVLTDKDLRRFDIIVGVAYGEDIDKARSIIEESMKAIDVVEQDKPIEVYAREFNSSSIDFTVRWWSESSPLGMHKSRDKVVTAIKAALDNENIEIPFPYRTLTFKEPLSIKHHSG